MPEPSTPPSTPPAGGPPPAIPPASPPSGPPAGPPAGGPPATPPAGGPPGTPSTPPAGDPPAPGERPAWCQERFWDAAKGAVDTEKLHQSFVWAQSKLGGRTGAPDPDPTTGQRYKLNQPDGLAGVFDDKDPRWLEAQELFADLQLDQAAADKVLRFEAAMRAAENQAAVTAVVEGLAAHGLGNAQLQELSNWGARQFGPDWDTVRQSFGTSVEGTLYLAKVLRPMLSTPTIPAAPGGGPGAGPGLTGTPKNQTELGRMYERQGSRGGPLYLEDSDEGRAWAAQLREAAANLGG